SARAGTRARRTTSRATPSAAASTTPARRWPTRRPTAPTRPPAAAACAFSERRGAPGVNGWTCPRGHVHPRIVESGRGRGRAAADLVGVELRGVVDAGDAEAAGAGVLVHEALVERGVERVAGLAGEE